MTPSQILISNAKYLCRKNKIRIQDFEEEIGYRPGYLKQIFNDERSLKLETAIQISEKFGISLTEMINCDVEKQERILALERELAKLKEKTA